MKVKGDEIDTNRHGRDGPSHRYRSPATQILAMTTAPKFHIKVKVAAETGSLVEEAEPLILQFSIESIRELESYHSSANHDSRS